MNLFNLFPKLSEKCVTLSDLDILYRVFVNWSENEIIDYKVSDSAKNKDVTRKRVELNYFEALWILIVQELRLLGIPLRTIKRIKEYLFTPIDRSYFNTLHNDELLKIIKQGLPDEITYHIDKEKAFNKEVIESVLDKLPESYNMYFTNLGGLVSSVLLFGHSPSLMIYKSPLEETKDKDKEVGPNVGFHIFNPVANEIEAKMNGRDFRDELVSNMMHFSIINIPIVPLIAKFYRDEALYKYTEVFALYSPSELELLKLLKQKDFQQIRIYRSHNKETFEVEITSEQDLKNNEAQVVRTLLGLKKYERAEVIFRNDKHIVIKNIIKHQI
ncbi:hypothetical protein V8G56_04085 [Gaetbulibacter aquiaggeris]|uniref:WYL domain-containing protein n=1 Tax=Gaetbulibacter aquiaggeris TaxID=1735373 RepID=A0ABW7MRV7_9FLAO